MSGPSFATACPKQNQRAAGLRKGKKGRYCTRGRLRLAGTWAVSRSADSTSRKVVASQPQYHGQHSGSFGTPQRLCSKSMFARGRLRKLGRLWQAYGESRLELAQGHLCPTPWSLACLLFHPLAKLVFNISHYRLRATTARSRKYPTNMSLQDHLWESQE